MNESQRILLEAAAVEAAKLATLIERKRITEVLWTIAERMRQDNPHGCHALVHAIAEIKPK